MLGFRYPFTWDRVRRTMHRDLTTRFSSTDSSAGAVPVRAEPTPAGRRKVATALPREIGEFLVEFSIVLHSRRMYPDGHPQLQQAAARFTHRLERLLESREAMTLGVAYSQLLVDGTATDPGNALLRDLAERLHRHRLSSIRFEPGISLGEIDDLVGALSADPLRGQGALGQRLHRISHWKYLKLAATDLDQLSLRADMSVNPTEEQRNSETLWIELARLSLGATDDADSGTVARAIEAHAGEVAYDSVVVDYLSRIAEEMSGRVSPAEDRLRDRVSELIRSLDPQTLRRLLEAGAAQGAARQFALNAAQVLAVDAVVEVLEAAAGASGQTISHQLLRLLHKLAHHAENGTARVRDEASGALRQKVAQLAAGWELEDPNPSGYTAILDHMVRDRDWQCASHAEVNADPENILRIALEIGSAGPRVIAAADRLANRRLGGVLELLLAAPQGEATETLWRHVATADRLRAALTRGPCDRRLVELLADRLGPVAVGPLLDALAGAERRATRAWLLRLLARFGRSAAEEAVARLDGAPWYVQRNLLVLVNRVGVWPPGFAPAAFLTHAHRAVRREAVKLGLASPSTRSETLLVALRDQDDGVVVWGIRAAADLCPPEALPALEAIARDARRDPEMRARAVRVVGQSRAPGALDHLLELAVRGRRWLPRRLGPKSPEVLAALAALAAYWGDDPAAAKVLAMARRHPDPDYATAAMTAPA